VTLVGGPDLISTEMETELRQAGCRVARIFMPASDATLRQEE